MLQESNTSSNKNQLLNTKLLLWGIIPFSLVILPNISFAPILRMWFTGGDTLALIETSQIQTPNKIVAIFSTPMMSGSTFTNRTLYYRPITSVSFAIDHLVWNLNPFGYHLTDLLLHILVTILVFYTMYYPLRGGKAVSWLGAAIFSIHPILAEVVPAIARRQDILASFFTLVSFLLFWAYTNRSYEKNGWMLAGSLIGYMLALGSKEISFLLPILIMGYFVLYQNLLGSKKAALLAIYQLAPYFVITLFFFIIRMQVLGGLGGKVESSSSDYLFIIQSYFSSLFYPQPYIPGISIKWIFVIAVSSLLISLLYIYQTKQGARLYIFLLGWIFLPLFIYLASHYFSARMMYFPAIPLAMLIALILVSTLKTTHSAFQKKIGDQPLAVTAWITAGVLLLMSFSFTVYLLVFSPIFQPYNEWKDSADISKLITKELSTVVETLPEGNQYTINITDLPKGVRTYDDLIPKLESVTYLTSYSLKSYLRLAYPDREINVKILSSKKLNSFPQIFTYEVKKDPDGKNISLIVHPEK